MKTSSAEKRSLQRSAVNLIPWPWRKWLFGLVLFTSLAARAATVEVEVGTGGGSNFSPENVSINPGDTVRWTWTNTAFPHSVISGTDGHPDGRFGSQVISSGTFSHTFPDAGTYPYYCSLHWDMGMTGTVTVSGSMPPTASQPLNISTRLRVQTGENVMIGGFIITGNDPKKVIIRAIGPSLAQFGLTDLLPDTTLELRASNGSLISANDNWKDTQRVEIEGTGIPPQNDLESAIVATLAPGAYTAIVSGKNGSTGVGVVEGYDLSQTANSTLANISTRGLVQTGSNVMIGGFILGGGSGPANIIVRAIGPSLVQFGIAGAMADPTLELRDANGGLVKANDNWKTDQQTEIQATGLPPQNDFESAIFATLSPAAYTAIVAGKNGGTGVGLVELYRLP